MTNYLIYQAYGHVDILNEALFSILSWLRQAPDAATQALVYTDNPAYFRAVLGELPAVQYAEIPAAQWREWRGEIDFVHRVKIKLLQHTAATHRGNFLYLDTDTVLLSSPAPIFAAIEQGQPFMHVSEGSLREGNSLNKKINQALQQPAARQTLAGSPISPATLMYNAGVLGFRSAEAARLDEVLQLTETLYRLYPKHVMEQLAFSAVLAQRGPVREAGPWVYHYWNLKEARPVLQALFAPAPGRPLAAWQARAQRLDLATHAAHKAVFRQNPGWRRAVLRWLGRDWKMPAVQFDESE